VLWFGKELVERERERESEKKREWAKEFNAEMI
jgi:hypothetical protein